jgi:hypothetical protein
LTMIRRLTSRSSDRTCASSSSNALQAIISSTGKHSSFTEAFFQGRTFESGPYPWL